MADLAGMLPGPRFTGDDETHSVAEEQRNARRERRRLANLSPGGSRNAQASAGESGPESGPAAVTPTRSASRRPTDDRVSDTGDAPQDLSRFGLVAPDAQVPESPAYRSRRRLSSNADHVGGGRTPSETGSDLGSPARSRSRTDLARSSYGSDSGSLPGVGGGKRRSGRVHKSPSNKPIKTSFAEMHVIGEIVGGSGFRFNELFCRWQVVYEPSKSWTVLQGLQQGATQSCKAQLPEDDFVVWEHPLDIVLQTQSLQGWPALLLMVYSRNSDLRDSFVSYALVPLPNTPGMHKISTQTWFAVEANKALGRRYFAWYTGLLPRLEDETFITDLRKREDAGPFICTVAAGEVHLRLGILFKNLDQVEHLGGESLAAALERLTTNILRQSTQLANRSAAVEEHQRSSEAATEGQKLLREGRNERFSSARAAIEARRGRGDASPLPSESSRTSMADPGARGSFRQGRAGGGDSGRSFRPPPLSDAGGQDDARSETSQDGVSGKDRYAARMARRAREKSQPQVDSVAQTPGASFSATASPLAEPLAGDPSADGSAGGGVPRTSSAEQQQTGAAARAALEDDGMEEIGDVLAGDGGSAADRAAARAARRAAAAARSNLG